MCVYIYNILCSVPYGRLILRGENFKVFTDFALSLKF